MKNITLEELLEAGCHFGHQVTRQNPKARDYIFEARDNIHIIDLVKTKEGLQSTCDFVRKLAVKGGSIIMVATKRQAKAIVAEELKRIQENLGSESNFYYVTNRWIGGILTNSSEVAKNFKKLNDIAALLKDENERAKYTKKELGDFQKDMQKLESFYGGIKNMKGAPDALFIVDTHLEHLAVREALATGVTTVGIVDTNADPNIIDYPIPANDDAVGSLKCIIGYVVDAWIEGKKQGELRSKNQESVKEEKVESSKEIKTEEKPTKIVKKKMAKKKSE